MGARSVAVRNALGSSPLRAGASGSADRRPPLEPGGAPAPPAWSGDSGVPLLPADAAPLREVEARGGQVNNLYRSLANHPVLLEAWTNFAWTLRGRCATPRALRELLILRASQLRGSRYLWDDHVRFGEEAGLTTEKIERLASWRGSAIYDKRERAALELTEQLTVTGGVADDTLCEVERHFSPDEVVEIVVTIAFYSMAPRVLDALRVPLMTAEPG
ncbi:MAG: carboxymuconolactone decarboxylase family protein [Solirubrobacterales bacterium]